MSVIAFALAFGVSEDELLGKRRHDHRLNLRGPDQHHVMLDFSLLGVKIPEVPLRPGHQCAQDREALDGLSHDHFANEVSVGREPVVREEDD